MNKGNFVSVKDFTEIIKSVDAPFPFHEAQIKKKFFDVSFIIKFLFCIFLQALK